jgi:hypothetical protein
LNCRIDGPMNQYETMFLIGFIAFYLPAFGLYHLMVFRVNRQVPPDRRIPHSLYFGGWSRLTTEYKTFYPRSVVYQFALTCAVITMIVAVSLAGFRLWEYVKGK